MKPATPPNRPVNRCGLSESKLWLRPDDLLGVFGLDQLATRHAGFCQYAKIPKTVAAGIQSGAIQVPK